MAQDIAIAVAFTFQLLLLRSLSSSSSSQLVLFAGSCSTGCQAIRNYRISGTYINIVVMLLYTNDNKETRSTKKRKGMLVT